MKIKKNHFIIFCIPSLIIGALWFYIALDHNPQGANCEYVNHCMRYNKKGNYFQKNGFRYATVSEFNEKENKCIEKKKYNYIEKGNWVANGNSCRITPYSYIIFTLGFLILFLPTSIIYISFVIIKTLLIRLLNKYKNNVTKKKSCNKKQFKEN